MCGIAGVARTGKLEDRDRQLVRRMCDVMVHRGPDDEGYHFADSAAIAIRRLSIIDLQTGHQPLFNEDGSLAVVLNGEIYNYRDLRQELIARGHRLTTTSDTETIVHLYEEYGDDCVSHLRGMFCFALWDQPRQRLLLARDRVGIKQLYYTLADGTFLFGSEIKCILESGNSERRVDPASVADYLTFLYVPAPATMLRSVHELPPAHTLAWEEGKIDVRRYWRLSYNIDRSRPAQWFVQALESKVQDAVRSHLVSDVPLGAFLSGGIDSGTVVGVMAEAMPDPVETFTIGLEGDYGYYDERKEAALVAQRHRTHHHEFAIRPDLMGVLPNIVTALDQPVADSSAIPTYYICQQARTHVTVALSGMGGDELAGGYERYVGVLLGKHYRRLPAVLRRALARALHRIPDWGGKGRISASRLKRFVSSADRDLPEAYLHLLSTFSPQELQTLLVGEWRQELQHFHPRDRMAALLDQSGAGGDLNGMLFADLNGYLPGDLLTMTDRMSMAHSLEVRVPLLDHELLEFMATVPPELKIRSYEKKYLLREVARKYLPPEIVAREKRGFSIPLAFWLREELRDFVRARFAPERVAAMGYFDPGQVTRIVDEHLSMRANHENKIWALLVFCMWHDIYVARELPVPAAPPAVVPPPRFSV